ncbi:uncharacterized protein LOC143039089 [Oratosquilla oratoria]|uniref:uncharacterized protein LOC143039089 n=1 Tax=Oratosquilla oratoria TaxID=337810 RepID=UPI003F7657CD
MNEVNCAMGDAECNDNNTRLGSDSGGSVHVKENGNPMNIASPVLEEQKTEGGFMRIYIKNLISPKNDEGVLEEGEGEGAINLSARPSRQTSPLDSDQVGANHCALKSLFIGSKLDPVYIDENVLSFRES